MKKTNVDDLLIEMITPKVQEIEQRFSSGEGLSNEDINTSVVVLICLGSNEFGPTSVKTIAQANL